MPRFISYFIIALATFFTGIVITVFWIFYDNVKSVPPIQADNFLISNSENSDVVKRKQIYQKQRAEDFIKFKKVWNAKVLGKSNEKSLEKLPDSVSESYRFIWIPSFHSPVAIRFWRTDDKSFLVAKSVVGEGFEIKKPLHEKTKLLTEAEWLKLLEFLREISFWDVPALNDEEPVIDGALYVLEGNKNKRFHEIHRAAPSEKLREMGAFLIELSDLKTEYQNY